MKNPNPQGKGTLPVLQALSSINPARVSAKPGAVLLGDYCLSTLVLGARFGFKPVPGKLYHLYYRNTHWDLSLVGPSEWTTAPDRHHLADCWLRSDMTWGFTASPSLADNDTLREALENHLSDFCDNLSSQQDFTQNLPFYVAELPYFARLLATGLATSLRQSLQLLDAPAQAEVKQLARLGAPGMALITGGSQDRRHAKPWQPGSCQKPAGGGTFI
jgi:hypothetical protein